jgi:glycerol-3-phosphate dehydrogenase subunit C
MGGTIVYYHGCFVNYFDHETGIAVVKVLEKNGFQVEVPKLICCSYPLLNSGDFSIVRKRATLLIEMLGAFAERGFDIVYSCPTCGYALKEVFPDLLESKTSRLVAEKTRFISTFLLELHREGNLNVEFENKPLHIAYHTPCHLKSQDSSSASAELLSLIPGIDLRCLNRGCCGMGGTWALRSKLRNELSGEIGKSVFEEIKKVSPQLVSTDCAGCQIQIARYSDLSGDKIVHPIQILAETYSNGNTKE